MPSCTCQNTLPTECLVSLGTIKPDGDLFTLSREDIERFIGE